MNQTLDAFVSSVLVLLATIPSIALGQSDALPGKGTWTEGTLRVGNVDRCFLIYRPTGLKQGAPTVLLLHGGTQSMHKLFSPRAGGTRAWPGLADREGFLLIVPNGTNAKNGDPRGNEQNWNDLRPPDERQTEADDVRFLLQLLDHAAARYRTDPQRVYVTGASNGGMMTFRLLIEAPERFAAAAAFIAVLPADLTRVSPPRLATPLLIANGTNDPLVKWDGGVVRGQRTPMLPVEASRDWWVRTNGAGPAKAQETLPDNDPKDGCRLYRTVYPPVRPNGAPVEFLRMEGAGHALPSRSHDLPDSFLVRRLIGQPCRDAEGAELAWAFMSVFRR